MAKPSSPKPSIHQEMKTIRLKNQKGQTLVVDPATAVYIDHLKARLALAEDLCFAVAKLNPDHLALGAGTMAELKDRALRFSASKA